jgi:hypothetical protein
MPQNEHERPLLQQARELADINGWLHYHPPQCQHARNESEAGFPDLILVRGDRLMAVEIKRPYPDKPTDAQMRWLRAIGMVKTADAYVLRPGPNLDDLAVVLK